MGMNTELNNLSGKAIRFNLGSIEAQGWGEEGALVIAIDYTSLPEIKAWDETDKDFCMTPFGFELQSEIEQILAKCRHSKFKYMVGNFGFVVDSKTKTARAKLHFAAGDNWNGRRAFRNEVIKKLCAHRLFRMDRKINASALYLH